MHVQDYRLEEHMVKVAHILYLAGLSLLTLLKPNTVFFCPQGCNFPDPFLIRLLRIFHQIEN